MARIKHRKEAPEVWALKNIARLIYRCFILAFAQIVKTCFTMHMGYKSNFALNLFGMGIITSILVLTHFWYGLAGFLTVFVLAYFAGLVNRRFSHVKPVKVLPSEIPVGIPVIFIEPKVSFKVAQKTMKRQDISSFRTSDGKQTLTMDETQLNEWLAKNPDLKVVGKM
jgi:hypothetical protein